VRDRGIDLTSITMSTPDSRKRSTNSTIVLVEWPMVKKVFVSSLHAAKARDQPASLLILSARCRKQKRALVERYCDFEEPTGNTAVGGHAAQLNLNSVRELTPLQFFGGIGSNDRAEDLQNP
jgi:hypothetical protein